MTFGRFLVVEGLEGAGKSSAIQILHSVLIQHGIPCVMTREPGGTELGEVVRQIVKTHQERLDPRTELLLFYAARVQLLQQIIEPSLAKGLWVLADRFELSSFAYQGGGRGVDSTLLQQLSKSCVGATQPDLVFYLDIAPEIGLQRAIQRGKLDRIEQESLDFFNAVYAAYQAYIPTMPSAQVIDANQPLDKVQQDLRLILEHYLADHHARA